MHTRGYVVERVLGNGAFGQVFLAQNRSRSGYFAVKKMKKLPHYAKNIIQEVNAGIQLSHPNIIKFVESFEDDENAYIVSEYLPGTKNQHYPTNVQGSDLFSFIEEGNFTPIPEFHTRRIFKQIAEAVAHSHSNGIVHLDIKLDNIMINRANLKATLIDYGLCQSIDSAMGDQVTKRCGSPEYASPEMCLFSTKEISISGKKVDSWCLGVVLYAMLTATFPFNKTERVQLATNCKKPTLSFFNPVSENAQDLVEKLLCVDPSTRMSVEDIVNHPWMNS